MKVIMRIAEVPEGATVTKGRTGTQEFIVRDKIVIHGMYPHEIKATPGVRFLVGNKGYAEAVDRGFDVVWSVDERELLDFLHERIDLDD